MSSLDYSYSEPCWLFTDGMMLSSEHVYCLLTAKVKLQLGVMIETVSMKSSWTSELNVAFFDLQIDLPHEPGDFL